MLFVLPCVKPDRLILFQPLCLHWWIRVQVRLSLRTCSGSLEKPLWLAIARLSWVCGPGGCFQLQSPRAWQDALIDGQIWGTQASFNPLAPSITVTITASLAPCPILFSNASLSNFLLLWSHSGTLLPRFNFTVFSSLVSASVSHFLCVFVSRCLPFIFSISHISLYPFLFHPQHFSSQSRGPGLPAVDYHTSDCTPSLHGPISCIRLNISQKLAQFRWICVCLDKWYVVKCVWVISLCSGITVMCVTKESLLLWMQCNPVIFKGWAWGLEGAHVRTSAALSVPVSSLKKKKQSANRITAQL